MGKHKPGIRHKQQQPPRTGGPSASPGSVGASGAQAQEPDRLDADLAQRAGAGRTGDPAQTDIERADEHKSGSVEALPRTDAAAGLASFTDSADQAGSGPATAPYLREG